MEGALRPSTFRPVDFWLRGERQRARARAFAYTMQLRVRVPRMGMGGAKFRTWSGPGGSSHKGPLTSAHTYSGHFLHSALKGNHGHHRFLH